MIERKEEQQRVDEVIKEINTKEGVLLEKASGLKESVVGLRETFFEDVTVNLDDPDEVIETHASIKQQAELLSERERSHGIIDKQLKVLQRLKDSPYFGRIDFHEDGEKITDRIYIGIASLMDNKDENFLIYDWRAPISSLYYDYPPGNAEFETRSGKITGEMLLKRQFVIKQGKIAGMFDTGLTIGDELLQQALGNHASQQMRSIVATIQKEQNQIIRNEHHKYLIVQGVAGSGKTSAALQRVAYLMYRHRDILHEDNIILFSPNPLFNSYVSNVLPELGEANMRQTTFLEYLIKKVDEQLIVETPFEQMEYKLTANRDNHYHAKMKSIEYKSSLEFKKTIDEFILYLKSQGIVFKHLTFRDRILVSSEDIYQYFYDIKQSTSISNSLALTSEWLLKELQKYRSYEFDEDWVMEEIEGLDDEDFLDTYEEVQEREDEDDFYDSGLEEEFLRGKVIERAFAPLKEEVNNYDFVDLFATYRQMFETWSPQNPPAFWNEIKELTTTEFDNMFLSWEEATPYIYFKERLLGENTDRSVKYLFIDEAQDYTEFQLAYFKHIFPHTRMTFLGDVNQAILAYTSKGNPLQAEYEGTYEKIELKKSYRSTKQIVEFSKHFSPSGDDIEPFERAGNKPKLIRYNNLAKADKYLVEAINDLVDLGNETIAIVCKTFNESESIYEQLKDKISLNLMKATSRDFSKGILVLPIYLAKGIEFDAVVIPDASKYQYRDEFDQSIFYTACTRAMHDLVMLSRGEESPFIKQAPDHTYEIDQRS